MEPDRDTLVRLLLAHFDATRRDVPWRRTADPYAIWVSEVMLQQTRVDTVIPYFERWIAQFPTIDALADAPDDTVLRAWEGLGYYSRARNLHAAAKVVRELHSGAVPDNAAALRTLPGVGAYTAGAVSSIAYNRAEPAIDGNARRVFARLFDLEADTIPIIHALARTVVPEHRPGDFNQAIMELGASICTPRPRCPECPLRTQCAAYTHDTVHLRPSAPARRDVPAFDVAVAVIIGKDGRTVVQQRPADGLLAGLWEFPALISKRSHVRRDARALAAKLLGGPPPRAHQLQPVPHVFTHRVETYHPFIFRVTTTDSVCDVDARAVDTAELHALTLPRAQRRIAAAAGLSSPAQTRWPPTAT